MIGKNSKKFEARVGITFQNHRQMIGCQAVSVRGLGQVKVPSRPAFQMIRIRTQNAVRIRIQVYKPHLNTEVIFNLFVKVFFLAFFLMKTKYLFLTGPQDHSIRVRENLIHRRDLDPDPH
jgi:hypothetical protein